MRCQKGKKQDLHLFSQGLLSNFAFFSIWVFFFEHSPLTGKQRKEEAISLTTLHLFHRHLDINQTITAESSPRHIASSWTQSRNHWFPRRKSLTSKLPVLPLLSKFEQIR